MGEQHWPVLISVQPTLSYSHVLKSAGGFNKMRKICTGCGETKTVDDFMTNNQNPDGKHHWCRNCMSIYHYRKQAQKMTPEEKTQYLYKLYMRGEEDIEKLAMCFECDKEIIIETLRDLGIYSEDKNLLFCSKCNTLKNINKFTSRSELRRGYKSWCNECIQEYNAGYYVDNSDVIKENTSEYYYENHEESLVSRRKYHHENYQNFKEKKKEYALENYEYFQKYYKNYYLEHRDERLESVRLYVSLNRGKVTALSALYRAMKLQATPKWLTKEHKQQIQEIYIESARLTKETGIRHAVDHLVPLQGRTVCGLHVPWNLQILTFSENSKKSNKLLIGN